MTSESPLWCVAVYGFLIIFAAVNLPCKAMIYLIDMTKPLNINALVPPPPPKGGEVLSCYSLRYCAALLVLCGGAFYFWAPRGVSRRPVTLRTLIDLN